MDDDDDDDSDGGNEDVACMQSLRRFNGGEELSSSPPIKRQHEEAKLRHVRNPNPKRRWSLYRYEMMMMMMMMMMIQRYKKGEVESMYVKEEKTKLLFSSLLFSSLLFSSLLSLSASPLSHFSCQDTYIHMYINKKGTRTWCHDVLLLHQPVNARSQLGSVELS